VNALAGTTIDYDLACVVLLLWVKKISTIPAEYRGDQTRVTQQAVIQLSISKDCDFPLSLSVALSQARRLI
jgi:hypothetical protein